MINHRSSSNNDQEQKKEQLISRMTNSVLAFLTYVFILKETKEYRLVMVIGKDKLYDSRYKTLRGAKLACNILTRGKMYKSGIKPAWSSFYPVEEKWLMDKLNKTLQKNRKHFY